MSDLVRHSQADDAELILDPELRAQREVQNGLKQFEQVVEMINYHLDPQRPFRFVLHTCKLCNAARFLG